MELKIHNISKVLVKDNLFFIMKEIEMIYIFLSVIGILSVLVVKPRWNEKIQAIFIVSSILIGLAAFLSSWYFLKYTDAIEKSTSSFWSQIPWIEICLYFSMLVGMAAKYFYDAVDSMGRRKNISFCKWQSIKPFLVSPIVFSTVYLNAQQNSSAILLLIFAFQNGFFWQTVLNKPVSLISQDEKLKE